MRSKLQKVANTFANRCAAGFPREDMRDAASLKTRHQPLGLCGLSASFRSFKRDERQSRHLPIVKQSSLKVELGFTDILVCRSSPTPIQKARCPLAAQAGSLCYAMT